MASYPPQATSSMKEIFTPIQTACLATACFCSLVTFSAMSDADGYDYVSAFQFTVAAGVLIWLYTGVLLVLLLTNGSGQPPAASFENHVKMGNRLALFFSYSGAIACSAISSDLNEYECTNSFCSKVIAACTFLWFTTVALTVCVVDQDTSLLDEYTGMSSFSGGGSGDSPYAAHHGSDPSPYVPERQAEPAYDAPPPSADL